MGLRIGRDPHIAHDADTGRPTVFCPPDAGNAVNIALIRRESLESFLGRHELEWFWIVVGERNRRAAGPNSCMHAVIRRGELTGD
jgi:hypothetical protein